MLPAKPEYVANTKGKKGKSFLFILFLYYIYIIKWVATLLQVFFNFFCNFLVAIICNPNWLRGRDLNPWPLGYEPSELPSCSTPRCLVFLFLFLFFLQYNYITLRWIITSIFCNFLLEKFRLDSKYFDFLSFFPFLNIII